MKKTVNCVLAALVSLAMGLSLFSCSGSGDSSRSSLSEVVASKNFNKINEQLDKAVAEGDFASAFAILNLFPAHFDKYSRFYYNSETGEFGEEDWKKHIDKEYTYEQYCRKVVSVLKAESDVLLSTNDTEAESLFLEHLADFDLGVNTVNVGEFYYISDESKANEKYQKAVTIYNDYLISVIRKSMVKSNPSLAKKISLLLKDGLSFKKSPTESKNYIWAYDTEAKDEAKEIITSFNAI